MSIPIEVFIGLDHVEQEVSAKAWSPTCILSSDMAPHLKVNTHAWRMRYLWSGTSFATGLR